MAEVRPPYERAKVCDKGLLTWPARITSRLALKIGDYLYVFEDGRRLTLITQDDLAAELLQRGIGRPRGKRTPRKQKPKR
jgi:bifunctional DNA-binding transcriptional regulator/antitoxin component of YhaV-PrlF toxin-antitoxin module